MTERNFLPSLDLTERLLRLQGVIGERDSIKGKKFTAGWSDVDINASNRVKPREYLASSVIGSIASLAQVSQERREREITIGQRGSFSDEFSNLFLSINGINSNLDKREFYSGLYTELSQFAAPGEQYPWGKLTASEAGIYVVDIPENWWFGVSLK